MQQTILRRVRTSYLSVIAMLLATSLGFFSFVFASPTSNFQLTINPGTLTIDIVDGSFVTVASPSVVFNAVTFSFSCQSTPGTFGTASEQIYIQNPDAADNGWTASLAADSGPTSFWDSAGTDMDFNDPTGAPAGCADGADTDSLAGQLSINPSVATLAVGNCLVCTTTGVTLGSSSAFSEGVTDSITIATAAAGANDIADYTIQGVSASQQIPPEQPAASDYNIDMTLSIVAS